MLQLVLPHDKTKKAHSVSKRSYKFKQELNTPKCKQEILTKMKKMAQHLYEASKKY